jgi:cell division control protein 11
MADTDATITAASPRSSAISNDSTMSTSPKNHASSAILVSGTTEFMPCSTSSLRLAMGTHLLLPTPSRQSSQKIWLIFRGAATDILLPTSLRELDIELMRRLAPRVNVIPVIGRADSLTPSELAQTKKLIMEDIEYYRIPVYNFPYDIEEDDEDTVEENAELRGLLPFAIVGSEQVVEIDGRKVRARQYPWGMVEVENPRHSDFLAVRSALLHTHLLDLKEITFDFLYENYRTEKLSKTIDGGDGPYVVPFISRLISKSLDLADMKLHSDSSVTPEDLATQSIRLKEQQLRQEEEKFREIEIRVQREINEKRQELLAREAQLREIEARIQRETSEVSPAPKDA